MPLSLQSLGFGLDARWGEASTSRSPTAAAERVSNAAFALHGRRFGTVYTQLAARSHAASLAESLWTITLLDMYLSLNNWLLCGRNRLTFAHTLTLACFACSGADTSASTSTPETAPSAAASELPHSPSKAGAGGDGLAASARRPASAAAVGGGRGSSVTTAAAAALSSAGSAAAGTSAGSSATASAGSSATTTTPGAAGASGASDASGSAGTSVPNVRGPDCDIDPLANTQPYGSGFYQQFTGLFGCTAPADLALFRKMLPEKFEMPAEPQVCFYTIDFKITAVGPYHEMALLLPITYKGKTGKYVLTMDLDNSAATNGGRLVGFPKYMGEVTIEQQGDNWTGTASANGTVDLKASYVGECTKSDELLWPDFINLTPIPSSASLSEAFLPPRTGSALRVPAEYLTPPKFHSLKGSIRLEIGDHLPWNGIVDESKPFPGLLSAYIGGVDLGNEPLD